MVNLVDSGIVISRGYGGEIEAENSIRDDCHLEICLLYKTVPIVSRRVRCMTSILTIKNRPT